MSTQRERPDGRDRYRHFIAITTRVMDNDLYNHLNNATEIGLFKNDEALTSARGHFVQVCCDRRTQKPIAMPAPVRAALEAIKA